MTSPLLFDNSIWISSSLKKGFVGKESTCVLTKCPAFSLPIVWSHTPHTCKFIWVFLTQHCGSGGIVDVDAFFPTNSTTHILMVWLSDSERERMSVTRDQWSRPHMCFLSVWKIIIVLKNSVLCVFSRPRHAQVLLERSSQGTPGRPAGQPSPHQRGCLPDRPAHQLDFIKKWTQPLVSLPVRPDPSWCQDGRKGDGWWRGRDGEKGSPNGQSQGSAEAKKNDSSEARLIIQHFSWSS